MDRELYRSLLYFVNDKKQMDLLQKYVVAKISLLHRQMENLQNHHEILKVQGAIAELRRFKTLRDETIKGAE
tara:strand:+ start:2143 stop:2358 length:216 start_codon:yes stop_codon:yes gene_type:complete